MVHHIWDSPNTTTRTNCGSHISCYVLGIVMSHTNAGPKCASRVQSSPRQSPLTAVTEAVCGTHSLRATRLKLGETADDTKRYTRTTYIGARSRPVNSELDPIAMKRGGMKYECSRTQRDMLWCENEHSYVLCDTPWCENECSHVPTRYVLVCKMYIHICYMI